ncbi:MAG: aldo/keto reductase [Ruminococcaceae bacterium]|nr:aldo/keto reductase [Oscillospiraceae bacterium]
MFDFVMSNGIKLPCPAFGTYKSTVEKGKQPILDAIEKGYRHFDTASVYGNETELGEAIKESGIPRSDFFITTKLWAAEQGREKAFAGIKGSLERLGLEYVDLYLLHWPRLNGSKSDPLDDSWVELNKETWQAMNEMYQQGLVKGIGVSNFLPHHLENIQGIGEKPMVNQIEFHPGYIQKETVEYCHSHGIVVEGWSPLGRGRVLKHPLLLELSSKYGISVARLCLRFSLQMGVLPLPKASSVHRINENMDLFNFEISQEDVKRICEMPMAGWSGEHPDRPRQDAVYF